MGCCLPDPLERSGSSNLEDMLQKFGYVPKPLVSCIPSLILLRYQIHTFSSCDMAIVTEYPWRNHLSLLLAIFFVYPALKKYIKVYIPVGHDGSNYFVVYRSLTLKQGPVLSTTRRILFVLFYPWITMNNFTYQELN